MPPEPQPQPRCPKCHRPFQPGRTHCMWCGAALSTATEVELRFLCPNCPDTELQEFQGEGWIVYLCSHCDGVWMTSPILQRFETLFEGIPARRGKPEIAAAPAARAEEPLGDSESDVLPTAMKSTLDKAPSEAPLYRPCPQCRGQMARRRYRRVSGIIVDECLGHGVWFDAGEFQSAVAFLKQGGLAWEKTEQDARTAAAARARLGRPLGFFDRVAGHGGRLLPGGF